MIKNILAFGDSFTYGEELSNREEDSWPSVLAKKLNATVVNYAEPGGSNDKIVRRLIRALSNNKPADLVVIGWSSPGRTEYCDTDGVFDIWPGNAGRLFFAGNCEYRKDLLRHINYHHNANFLFEHYLQQIIIVQTLLSSHNINYRMCDIVANDYYKQQRDFQYGIKFSPEERTESIIYETYANKIDKTKFIDFGVGGMAEWAFGLRKGPAGHFLEDGHRLVADKFYEHIKSSD